ncbi:MAG TPA: SDR family oxidoreductase [Acidobacteriaceae bacterium]|jgi:3-oxoacyl-[acyl-carrier protein] reductase|nr:SDR family oxidoreductase [Acidobacteriaceae bacterium]
MSFTLEGRTALVTGSARGIGRAIATALLGSGANVMLNDLDASQLAQTASELGQSARVHHVAADLTQPDAPAAIVEATLSAFGGIDIIVNNAGYTWDTVIQKMTDQQFQAMLDIHLVAPFRILRAASDYIRSAAKSEATGGRRVMRKVVNITSIAGTDGNPGQAAYSSAKAGVIGLTKTLAKEWGRYNVNVNAVGFGLIETRLVAPASTADSTLNVHGNAIKIGVPPQALESLVAACPLGRLGTPEEAANAVLFFCSPLSDYVTSEVLICGGGLHF